MMESNHSSDKVESNPSQNNSTPLPQTQVNTVNEYQNETWKQNCENLQHRAVNIMAKFSRLKEANEVNKETIKSQAETIDALQNDITNVTAEISELKKTNEELQAENIQLNNTVATIGTSLETSENEKAEVAKSKKECDETINQLKTSLTEKQQIINQKDEENEEGKSEIVQLKETNAKLQAKNIQQNDTVASLKISLEKEKAERLAEVSALKSHHNAKETEYQDEINRLKNEVATMKTNLETSVASNSQIQNDKSALQQKCALMDDAKNESDVKILEYNEKIKNFPEARHYQITGLTNETIYRIKDVFFEGKWDYEKLNGNVLVVEKLTYHQKGESKINGLEISLENSSFKVYVQEELFISFSNMFCCNSVIYNNIEELCISYSTDTYVGFKKLISSCPSLKGLNLYDVTVKDENGIVIEIDQLWRYICEKHPNIEELRYKFKENEILSTTAQKLSQLPPFPNLKCVSFSGIKEGFDLLKFGEFIRKNPNAHYLLYFSGSNEFKFKIRCAEKELRQTLPSKCKLKVII